MYADVNEMRLGGDVGQTCLRTLSYVKLVMYISILPGITVTATPVAYCFEIGYAQ